LSQILELTVSFGQQLLVGFFWFQPLFSSFLKAAGSPYVSGQIIQILASENVYQ
jgi:hypothetical protein